MGISWIIFLVLVAIFAYRGYRQGIWAASTRVLSLVLAYTVALLFTGDLAPIIELHTVVQGMAALMTAGFVLFFVTSIVLSLLFSLVGRLFLSDKPSKLSASLGAVVGMCIGSLVGLTAVFFVSYLVEVLPKNQSQQQVSQHASRPSTGIERVARMAASTVVSWVSGLSDLDPATAKMSAALIRDPGVVVKHVKNLQQSQDVKDLFNSDANRAALKSGDVNAIQALPSFQTLVQNPDVQQLVVLSGLGDEEDTEAVLAEQMSSVWKRSELLKNDQRVQNLLSDPQFRQQIENGNPMALLNNAEFMDVAKLLMGGGESGTDQNETDQNSRDVDISGEDNNSTENDKTVTEPTIYQWLDDDGNVHYGDRKPQSN